MWHFYIGNSKALAIHPQTSSWQITHTSYIGHQVACTVALLRLGSTATCITQCDFYQIYILITVKNGLISMCACSYELYNGMVESAYVCEIMQPILSLSHPTLRVALIQKTSGSDPSQQMPGTKHSCQNERQSQAQNDLHNNAMSATIICHKDDIHTCKGFQ